MNTTIQLLCLIVSIDLGCGQLLVSLPEGLVQGREDVSPGNRTFHAFQGIPFATPPLGSLRFKAPLPAEKWSGILNATRLENICYQVTLDSDDESEDCLYLNVFTPVLTDKTSSKLPVIFWIYGGGFSHGSAKNTGPDFFIEQDIVMVSFNYRVGPFGFLSTGDNVIPGNAGLKDQLLALEWTNRNIHLFGGDPTKITLMGGSAGGASVGFHILSKRSSGLFRAGSAHSGSPISVWAYLADARTHAFDLAYRVEGMRIADDSDLLADYLRNVSAKSIDVASTKTDEKTALPTVEKESDDAFLTDEMYELLNSGDFNRVPLLIGTVSEEEIHIAANLDDLNNRLAVIEKDPSGLVPSGLTLSTNYTRSEVGEEIRNLYLADSEADEELGHVVRYYSHNQFSRAVIRHGEMQAAHTPVYFYKFSYVGPMGYTSSNVSIKGAEQIDHSGEKYYISKVTSGEYDNSDFSKFPASDVLTLRRMVSMWSNFVKYLNPTPEPSDLLQNVTWPLVVPGEYQYLDIDEDLVVRSIPKQKYYLAWKDIFDKYGARPFLTY
ncbi:juvenile hormone esterase-like [Cylas formicarius]|uniref:juvenile hormone esterase-like n=1 Tax=Cylas formicarius TaxID=197179 RepID=UPI002958D186|nr:juvenile hormone esterase-like [Cylas formicarius]